MKVHQWQVLISDKFSSTTSSHRRQVLINESSHQWQVLISSSYVTVCHRVSSHVSVCHRMQPCVIVCHRMSSCVIVCHRLSQPCVCHTIDHRRLWKAAQCMSCNYCGVSIVGYPCICRVSTTAGGKSGFREAFKLGCGLLEWCDTPQVVWQRARKKGRGLQCKVIVVVVEYYISI